MCSLLRRALEPLDVELVAAHDGPTALVLARRLRPRLVITEVRLAGLDGLSLCRQLRALPTTAETRVLVLTALAEADTPGRVRAAGADALLYKPFGVAQLTTAVETLLYASARPALPLMLPGVDGNAASAAG